MTTREEFLRGLKKTVLPILRDLGFRGSAPTLRRFVGSEIAQVFNVQASSGGDGAYVNVGAHPAFVEVDQGGWRCLSKESWAAIKEYDCAFRTRLEDFAGGGLFFYDSEASLTALEHAVKGFAVPFFTAFDEPGALAELAREAANEGAVSLGFHRPPLDAAVWAQIAIHVGDHASARKLIAQLREQRKDDPRLGPFDRAAADRLERKLGAARQSKKTAPATGPRRRES